MNDGQQSDAGTVVHQLAKPTARGLAWSTVLAALAALVAGTIRNLREE